MAAGVGATLRPGAKALVTGAASGIGRAVAERMLGDGVSVVAVDVNEEGLGAVAAQGARAVVADLADLGDRAVVIEAGRGSDYLVNAAGIIRLKSLWDVSTQDWRDVYAVNAEAVFFLMQGICPTMSPGGAVVNLSSTSAKTGTTLEAAVYASTKAAVLSLTRAFAFALADRPIRVNAILPGIVDTPMQDEVLDAVSAIRSARREELDEARLNAVWLGRAASPEECAGVICFLLSDEAGYMTGQSINYSGGLVTW